MHITLHMCTPRSRGRPRYCAAYLRAIFNGWPTSACAPGASSCLFGCDQALGRLEHYAVCPKAWAFFRMPRPQGLGIRESLRSLQGFFLAEHGMELEEKVAMAIGLYATSRAVTQARNATSQVDAVRLLRLHAKEGLRASKAWKLLKESAR